MDTPTIVLAVVVLLVIVLGALFLGRQRRSATLRERFGPEYDRTVSHTGDRREAESELAARERRFRGFELQALDAPTADRYRTEWRETQTEFVDSPSTAIHDADRLITRVMRDRGYPMDDFDQRADDVSVEHPDVVDNYRSAHDVALMHGKGEATTEQLREAMVHYRALFERLIETDEPTRGARR